MSRVIQEVKIRIFQERAALNPGWVLPAPRRARKKSKKKEAPPVVENSDNDTVSLASKNDARKGFRGILHKAKNLKTTFKSFTSKLTKLSGYVAKSKQGPEAFHFDLETGTSKANLGDDGPKPDPALKESEPKPESGPREPEPKLDSQLDVIANIKDTVQTGSENPLETQTPKTQQEKNDPSITSAPPGNEQPDRNPPAPEIVSFQEPSKIMTRQEPLADAITSGHISRNPQTVEESVEPPEVSIRTTRQNQPKVGAREDDGLSSKGSSRKPRRVLRHLNEHLIKGYLYVPKPGEIPPLQLRRTLDQYFYTHLSNTDQRDRDQVVWRYTRDAGVEPKIFMVDQVWLWVLDKGMKCKKKIML
jgi:hypothetical protein